MKWKEWEAASVANFVEKLIKSRNPYTAKPTMSQEEYDNLPSYKKPILSCNSCGKKVVSDQGMFCVECGIKIYEEIFSETKPIVDNKVIIE